MTMQRLLLTAALIAVLASGAAGQLIPIKTVPVATGDQFMIFPSRNHAMGGISIAVDDPLFDPFVNPAKGSASTGSLLFGSPSFQTIGGDNGTAKTIPFGGILQSDRLFGGAVLALQEMSGPTWDTFWAWSMVDPGFGWIPPPSGNLLSDQSATNLYAFGMIGSRIGRRTSIGTSFFYSDLSRLEGIDLLYQNSHAIRQSGGIGHVRVGLTTASRSGAETDVVLLYNRVDMTHNVEYLEWEQEEEPTEEGWYEGRWLSRIEENLDQSNSYGVHLKYRQPVGDGWRVGAVLTANYKTHPQIPNYDLMQIPRDPGNSRAFDIGLGLSRQFGRALLGVDLIYEPIRSDTWAEASEPVDTEDGGVIPVGGKTVENAFDFGNAKLRTGVGRFGNRVDLMLGLEVEAISYDLDQRDHVAGDRRFQHEEWQEWTGSIGCVVRFEEFHIRYTGRVRTGTGRPGIASELWSQAMDGASFGDIVLAPQGALTLQETSVFTHQLTLAVPVR